MSKASQDPQSNHDKVFDRNGADTSTFYTLVHQTKRLTIKISTLPNYKSNHYRYRAAPITGLMRGHEVFAGLGNSPQTALSQCLAKISGKRVDRVLNEPMLESIFASDLVTTEGSDLIAEKNTQQIHSIRNRS